MNCWKRIISDSIFTSKHKKREICNSLCFGWKISEHTLKWQKDESNDEWAHEYEIRFKQPKLESNKILWKFRLKQVRVG